MVEKHLIKFNPENHTYTVDGKDAISVTTLMKAVGLGKDFSNMPEAVKQKVKLASDRGNYYDELAEEAINDPFELNEWQEEFLKTVREHNLDLQKAQVRYGTLEPFAVAGTGDFEGRVVDEKGGDVIVDLKATYMIYKNDVTWQTNIYSYLRDPLKHDTTRKFVIHYNENNGKFIVMELKHISSDLIKKVFEAYQLGDLFIDAENVLEKVEGIQEMSEIVDKIKEYEDKLKEEKKKLDNIYDDIKKAMSENNVKTVELENFKITYTAPGTRRTVDYTKAAEEKNQDNLEGINQFLIENGRDPYKIITSEEIKELLTDEEKETYTKITNVKDRLTVTPLKKTKKDLLDE